MVIFTVIVILKYIGQISFDYDHSPLELLQVCLFVCCFSFFFFLFSFPFLFCFVFLLVSVEFGFKPHALNCLCNLTCIARIMKNYKPYSSFLIPFGIFFDVSLF